MKTSKPKASKEAGIGNFYIIVTVAVVCSAIVSLYFSAAEIRELKRERLKIEVSIEQEEKEQVKLKSQKHYYESDSFIEKTAREKLGLVKASDVTFPERSNK